MTFSSIPQIYTLTLKQCHSFLQFWRKTALFSRLTNVSCFVLISEARIEVKSTYLGKIRDWKPPHDLKALEKFLGFWGYHSCFIMGFAEKAFALSELRKNVRNKSQKYIWTSTCQKEFETLKASLLISPVRAFPILSTRNKEYFPTDCYL